MHLGKRRQTLEVDAAHATNPLKATDLIHFLWSAGDHDGARWIWDGELTTNRCV